MLDVISAEMLKFRRHRATWGLVWIWPIGITLFWLFAIGVDLANGGSDGGGPASAAAWVENSVDFWNVPAQPLGRYLLGAFVAVVFAGEYGWNTWKLIVPHRARNSLIAAKYVVALALLALSYRARRRPVQLHGLAPGRGDRRSHPRGHHRRSAAPGPCARPRSPRSPRSSSPPLM